LKGSYDAQTIDYNFSCTYHYEDRYISPSEKGNRTLA
jgi:hypothetical protein